MYCRLMFCIIAAYRYLWSHKFIMKGRSKIFSKIRKLKIKNFRKGIYECSGSEIYHFGSGSLRPNNFGSGRIRIQNTGMYHNTMTLLLCKSSPFKPDKLKMYHKIFLPLNAQSFLVISEYFRGITEHWKSQPSISDIFEHSQESYETILFYRRKSMRHFPNLQTYGRLLIQQTCY